MHELNYHHATLLTEGNIMILIILAQNHGWPNPQINDIKLAPPPIKTCLSTS